jgi:hypothetical protein
VELDLVETLDDEEMSNGGLSTAQHVVRRAADDRPLVRHFLQIVAEARG